MIEAPEDRAGGSSEAAANGSMRRRDTAGRVLAAPSGRADADHRSRIMTVDAARDAARTAAAPHTLIDDCPLPPPGRSVVLHVRVVSGSGGGPETTILQSAAHLHESNYWMAAAYMHRPGDPGFALLRQRAEMRRCPLIAIPDRGPADLRVVRRLLAVCRQLRVAIWHGHDYKSNLIGLLLRPLHPMTLVTTAHGWVTHTRRTPLYYVVDRWCVRRYDHVVTVSPDLDDVVAALGVPPARRTLIPNGVDPRRFRRRVEPAAAPLRAQRAVAPGRRIVGAVGRLSGEKRFDDLIRAAHALLHDGHDLELWIAGEGPARVELQALIDGLGVADRVYLLGDVADPRALYEAMDVYALSSQREGLPNALLEAMSMRVPVVAAAVGGVTAAVRDRETGLLYPAADLDALIGALRRALQDAALRRHLAAAARRAVEDGFTFAGRMAAERALYDRLRAAAT